MELIKYFLKLPFITKLLQDQQQNKLSSGYLFHSLDASTNAFAVTALAMTLLCKKSGCFSCENCIKILKNSHPDVLCYPKEKAFSVFDAKDIIEQAYKKPMIANFKIIIINGIDNSSIEAQNKLLKIIEEPPKNVFFLITTSNLDKVLQTIKSRLLKIKVPCFSLDEIKEIFDSFRNNENYSLAITYGQGYVGKTLEILKNENYLAIYEFCKEIVIHLKQSSQIINFLNEKIDKDKFIIILTILSSFYRDLLMLLCNQDYLVVDKDLIKDFAEIKKEFSINSVIKIINLINQINEKRFSNVSLNLLFETMLVKILEVKFRCK